MNKQVIIALLAGAFVLTVAGCGGGASGLIDKQIKLLKIGKSEKDIKRIDDEWTSEKKADATKKIEDGCQADDIAKLHTYADCQIKNAEKYDPQAKKCKAPVISKECEKQLGALRNF